MTCCSVMSRGTTSGCLKMERLQYWTQTLCLPGQCLEMCLRKIPAAPTVTARSGIATVHVTRSPGNVPRLLPILISR
ncbi:hypothetical protein EB796_003115 [Bugula neritina]|uniref:Uncharacterized protein n=1 Tax=Bugula neritina TaxID=10212 RepID=A0A7J7KKV7_BUGNE|nr:hypothetical protein EB796_003115 [Bugula neritina]